jgi:hypothetical protein
LLASASSREPFTSMSLPYRFRMNTIKGMQSLNLCGPGLALGA